MKGFDPAGWVTVDEKTGEITTAKTLDRESSYVKDGIYNVTVLVVDNGVASRSSLYYKRKPAFMTTGLNKYFNSSGTPSMTGTATLTIHVSDENDNSPTLGVNTIEMCQSDGASVANISVTDLDGDPYGGPFSFNVLGDVEGMWKVRPNQGRGLF